MSRYDEEVRQLTGWYKNRLKGMPPVEMSEEDYLAGVDRLPDHMEALVETSFNHWLKHRKYELSYNQQSVAFFRAALEVGAVILVPRHPVFRLGTKVVIKQMKVGDNEGDIVTNVPATIASVRGDEHMVEPTIRLGNDDRPGRTVLLLDISELEEHLTLAAV